jgi:hypothetical protein
MHLPRMCLVFVVCAAAGFAQNDTLPPCTGESVTVNLCEQGFGPLSDSVALAATGCLKLLGCQNLSTEGSPVTLFGQEFGPRVETMIIKNSPMLHQGLFEQLNWLSGISVSFCPGLFYVQVKDCARLGTLMLSNLDSLHTITISEMQNLATVNLSNLPLLRQLELAEPGVRFISINNLPALEQLTVRNAENVSSLSLQNVENLKNLNLTKIKNMYDLSRFSMQTNLETLLLRSCKSMRDISVLRNMRKLKKLTLYDCPQLSDIRVLEQLTSLQTVQIISCPQITDLSPLLRSLSRGDQLLLTPISQLPGSLKQSLVQNGVVLLQGDFQKIIP